MLPSGGGIRVLRQFTRHLSDRFDITVHVPEGGTLSGNGEIPEERVYPFPLWRKPSGMLRPVAPLFLVLRLLSFKKLSRIIAREINDSADLALVHNSMPVAAPPVLQFLEIPSLYFCFEHPRHIYENDIIQRTNSSLAEFALKPLTVLEKRMDLRSAAAATKIVTFSQHIRTVVKNIYNKDASIVKPGIDSSFFSPATVQRENFVLSVGALWPFKGHDTVIKIAGLLKPEIRPEVRIVADRGYPGYTDKLYSLAKSLSVDLTIQQNLTDTELRHRYRTAGAVVCCQRREPYGLVPIEAMACGTPVLAINEGGYRDNIINNRTGLLFSGNVEDGAELLGKLLDDSRLVAELTAQGRLFAESRTIEGGAEQLAEILDAL